MARVLLVEDSPDQAKLIGGLVQAGGFTVEISSTGEEAIEALASRAPDIVVTDLILPGLSGLDVVADVRQHHPLVPVILMTAFGSDEIAARALDEGAASYVPKRRLHDELVPTIRDTLALARARDERARMWRSLHRSEHHFVLDNDLDLIPPLAAFVHEGIRTLAEEPDDTELMQVGVALREALVNAMHHGNLEVGSELREEGGSVYLEQIERRLTQSPYRERRIHVTVKLTRTELVCVIRDEGPGFDPSRVPDPTDPDNLQHVSGRGLFLIWTFMDEVSHNDAGNEITLVKRLAKGEGADP
jgi:DNA-binding response OmpR family regulator